MKPRMINLAHSHKKAQRLRDDGRDGDAYLMDVISVEIDKLRENRPDGTVWIGISEQHFKQIAAKWPMPQGRSKPSKPPKPLTGPGLLFNRIIKSVTGKEPSPTCGCNGKARAMDAWGYLGCFKHRKQITGWLCAEAKRRNHEISEHKVFSLFKAAIKEYRNKDAA